MELTVDGLVTDKAALESRENQCLGRLAILTQQAQAPRVEAQVPFWLRVALDVGAVALSSTAAACWLVDECPDTLAVGLSVAGLGALGVRIALEF